MALLEGATSETRRKYVLVFASLIIVVQVNGRTRRKDPKKYKRLPRLL
jgi:hypothetical protein